MSQNNPKVGIVCLGEAGNLGDDLILIAAVEAVYDCYPEAEITYLSFGQHLDWAAIAEIRGLPKIPRAVISKPEIPFVSQHRDYFADRDVVIFGGGGLLHSSHATNGNYLWLSYLPRSGAGYPRVLATGLGLGPFNERWMNILGNKRSPFDQAWMRDEYSEKLANETLKWPSKICRDFIDDEFLRPFFVAPTESSRNATVLGVALRSWPGLSIEETARHVTDVASRHGCTLVRFFVLESAKGHGPDVEFTLAVSRLLRVKTETIVYRADALVSFLTAMQSVAVAVSMKLHSSAVWRASEVQMYPIYYAPKISSFFGKEFDGLEISRDVVAPVGEESANPRAAATVATGLATLLMKSESTGARFDTTRYVFQVQVIVSALWVRARKIVGKLGARQ
ncbi:polysaccharide pyruvyl transferase family protein [Paenarthrobacter ureafaciens]|uniref:polysaccharide pyruvyl transferase family protein n=1 Tax=Paenarthrobacter ureafaciens TaxID=37931 RepID=UPI0009AD82FE|nr:polysaccharide pyruvyl transferase family protein [Paenarthrobacter ureafaciens]GLU61377.1 hypothetical protein Pure01_38900 [Paenarthrobacter ureafaciens]GLU65677.1 hypothetical protein Pure02_39270 [Paenarthrobacter ureafaciens]GLU69990.1 hypothetical protein Pure03_39660 [Paenarthrobacter ureafaciens]GLU74237.1 hypothetical protein Pure04_39520 [Paenarthrobacter ureafaciens]GLU78448.1 hypothetical protein Pure05_38880 [Paenarthrobacter ureafaciens]